MHFKSWPDEGRLVDVIYQVRIEGPTPMCSGPRFFHLVGTRRHSLLTERSPNHRGTTHQPKNPAPALTHKDNNAANLRVVDPFDDPHIWAIIDDGCDACCHGELWHANAKEKWKQLGFDSYLFSKNATKFNGVGQSQTSGKWKMLIAIQLIESQLVLPGSLEKRDTQR